MHIHTRNVNTAFRSLVEHFNGKKYVVSDIPEAPVVKRSSRNGDVLMIDEPVTVTYERPLERVLFNQARDANPFFHLYHALWLLAGRNDVTAPAYYAKKYADYSDDGVTSNGSYGRRWKHGYNGPMWAEGRGKELANVNQLKILIAHLKSKPESRRAVLTMWNVEDDLLKVDSSKDVCCNTSVMFALRQIGTECETTIGGGGGKHVPCYALDMTVTNRSNDLVWGMLGEDFVTFSVLQEYVAAWLGVQVGKYHHFSNNLHVYEWNWKPEEWLNEHEVLHGLYCDMEDGRQITPLPLVKDPEVFERELPEFVERHSRDGISGNYSEPFLERVANPMCVAYHFHKRGETAMALGICDNIKADDWRLASVNWFTKRLKNKEKTSV